MARHVFGGSLLVSHHNVWMDPALYFGAVPYTATVFEQQSGQNFQSTVSITDPCPMTSNSVPNHDFGMGGNFANPVDEVDITYRLPSPTLAAQSSPLTLQRSDGVFLNGVKLGLLARTPSDPGVWIR